MSTCARLALIASLLLGWTASCTDSEASESTARGLAIVAPESDERPYFHDFGNVPYGQVLEHTFELVNTDPVPVTIRDLQPSCGCTVPEIRGVTEAGEEIRGNARAKGEVIVLPPGARTFITLKLDTKQVQRKNIDKLALVRLRCNSQNNAFMTFELHVVVKLLFQSTPVELDIGRVAESVGGSGFTEIARAIPDHHANVIAVESHDPALEVSLTESKRFGLSLWTLAAKLPPGQPLGPHLSEIVLETEDDQGRKGQFTVQVLGQVVTDIVTEPATAALGEFSSADGRSFEARLRSLVPGHRYSVSEIEVDGANSDAIQVEYSPVEPDEQGRSSEWSITLNISAGESEGVFSGHLAIQLDDPQYPTVRLPYSGTARP